MVFQLSLLSKKLRAEFSPQLCKMSCREIVTLLPAVGGRQHGMSLALSSLQAFPEKYRHDYGFHWLQVAARVVRERAPALWSHVKLCVLHK